MIESAVIIGHNNDPIYWHLPHTATSVSIDDDRGFWDIIWSHRKIIKGIAHSHPGSGIPGPSYTDITTFAAIESALGKRLDWWITNEDSLIICNWNGPNNLEYSVKVLVEEYPWVNDLRGHSNYGSKKIMSA